MDTARQLARLFEKRREAMPGLSYQQISDALVAKGYKTSTMTVYRLHSGKIQKPNVQDVLMLANYYRIGTEELNKVLGFEQEDIQTQEEIWKRDLKIRLDTFLGQAQEKDAVLAGQLLEVLTARLRGGEITKQVA